MPGISMSSSATSGRASRPRRRPRRRGRPRPPPRSRPRARAARRAPGAPAPGRRRAAAGSSRRDRRLVTAAPLGARPSRSRRAAPAVAAGRRDKRAAGRLDPLAQAGQSVARRRATPPRARRRRSRSSAAPSVIVQRVARAWRTTLVTLAHDPAEQLVRLGSTTSRAPGSSDATPAARSISRRGRQLAGERDVSVSGDRGPHIGQRPSAELLHLGDLLGRPLPDRSATAGGRGRPSP